MALHAEGEGFESPEGEVGIEWAHDGSGGVLEEADTLGELGIFGDEDAADDIAVAAEVFGDGVHGDVDAVVERALKHGGGEGVVAAGEDVSFAPDRGNGGKVGDFEEGVGGGFQPDEAGFICDRLFDILGVRHVDEGEGEPLGIFENLAEESAGAAVEVVHGDDMVALMEELAGGGDGGEAGGEGESAVGGVLLAGEG